LADLVLFTATVVGIVLIGAGTWLAYGVARLAEHPPLGWVLVTISFGTALIRSVIFACGYLLPSSSQGPYVYAGQLVTVPVLALVLAGAYYLRRDFMRQLRENQAALIAPEQ